MAAPPKDEKAKYLYKIYERARAFRSKFDSTWERDIEFLLGDQYLPKDFDWQANTISNLAFADIFSIIPWVGGRRPDVQLSARNPVYADLAQELSMTQSRVLSDNEIESRSIEAVFGMTAIGSAFWKNTWNKRLNGGLGGIELKSVPTTGMYLQPGKPHARDCDYIIEARVYDMLSALRRFPNSHDKLKEIFRKDNRDVVSVSAERGYGDAGIGYHAWFDTDPSNPSSPTPDTSSEAYFYDVARGMDKFHEYIEIYEIHFWDNSTHEESVEIEEKRDVDKVDVEEPQRKRVASYPNGHVTSFCGGYILEDRQEPFPGHPYIQSQNYYVEGYPYSVSDLSLIKPLQEQLNEANNRTFDAVAKSIGQTLLAGPASNLEDNQLEYAPHEIVHMGDINEVRELSRPRISSAMFGWAGAAEAYMEKVLGIEEALKGEAPGAVRSGFAIEQLQQASANHMKLKTLALELAIKDTAKYHTHIIAENYRPDIEYDPKMFTGLAVVNADGGEREMNMKDVRPHLFEYTIRAGINLRASRAADIQFFQWMVVQDIIDKEYFIQHADLPGKATLLKRMRKKWEREEAVEEMEMAARAQGLAQIQSQGGAA